MSNAWKGGSTRQWRRIRAMVLVRDRYQCQLRLPGCGRVADCVHHTVGKKHGDDPALLVASCTPCNLRIGEPGKSTGNPAPKPMTKW